jgi:hypothetical protein
MAEAEHYGDWPSYDYWYDMAERFRCIPDPELPDIVIPAA